MTATAVAARPEASPPSLAPQPRRFTADEYRRMAEVGVLAENERLELIAGEIVVMSPIGPLHADVVDRLARLAFDQCGPELRIRVQNPLALSTGDVFQPDLAILRPRPEGYATSHPTADDVLLVVEVADATLENDRRAKLPRYAAALVREVWIIDCRGRRIERFLDPHDGAYREQRTFDSLEDVRGTFAPFAVRGALLFALGG